MAIMRKGSRHEYMFTRFLGNGRVNAFNIEENKHHFNVPLTEFKVDGGTNEIIKAVKATPGYKEQSQSDIDVQEYRRLHGK